MANVGMVGLDWQERVNWDRLRKYRLERARERMKAHGLGAMLLMYSALSLAPVWKVAPIVASYPLVTALMGALFLPDDVPAMQPGVQINQVQIDLDMDTRLAVDLRLQHVTSINPDSRGVRLGCEFVKPTGDTTRMLQRFIDQTQKRRKLLAMP